MNDAYRGIAARYDAERMDWYAATYGPRLFRLLAERGVPKGRLLDAGCGTGTLALLAARDGWRVTGADLSPSLLEVARAKDAAGAVRWVEADLTALDLGERFDLVVSVGDVFNHLATIEDWGRAFLAVASHLEPGGLFFFDAVTVYGLERMDTYTVQDRPDGALILGIVWEPAERRSTLKITRFTPSAKPGLWERHTETIPEWGRPAREILERLEVAGFEGIERPFATSEDPEGEERLAVLARRGGR